MITVSSICSGISPEQAVELICKLHERLDDTEVGLELMPTKSTPTQSFLAYAHSYEVDIHSLHGPFLFRSRETLTQRVKAAFWQPIQGKVSFDCDGMPRLDNPAFEMSEAWGRPVIIHGSAASELADHGREKSERILGEALIRVENSKETLPNVVGGDYTPLKLAVSSAARLRSIGANVEGVCLDIGHLAVDAFKHGWQEGNPRAFMERFVFPADRLIQEARFKVTELHLHDFSVRRRRDHLALGEGCLPFELILEHFLACNPSLQLTLEIVPPPVAYLALSYLRRGYDEALHQVEDSIRHLRSIAPRRALV